jgi:LysM repeat protein/ABC-type branched-subunit amino acid transport system substrate-binding protein
VRIFFLFIVCWCTSTFIFAQEPGNEQKITENGKSFILYKVQAGETLYSIAKRYNVEIQKLIEINAGLANGLRSGEVLKIPDNAPVLSESKGKSDNKPSHFISHQVQRKETLYSISRKYGISIETLLEFNPGVTGLRKGDTLQIPQWKSGKVTPEPEKQSGEGGPGKVATHIVSKGETLYAISKKYGVSAHSILESNPEARMIKPGMRLIIPLGPTISGKSANEAENNEIHRIVKGETLYSISRKYGVSADLLVEMNPSLKKSCKVGSDIRIPKISGAGDTPVTTADEKKIIPVDHKTPSDEVSGGLKSGDCQPNHPSSRENKSFKVVMLLPLMITGNKALNEELLSTSREAAANFSENQPDSVRTGTKTISQMQFHENSENFFRFYEGALLAIDSLQQMGIKIDLEIWDTEQKASKVKNFVSSGILNNADLIIGPVYPNEQKEISDFVIKKKIPLISPLSPSDEQTRDNEYFFQVNPTREYTSEKTNEHIISSFRNGNLVVLQTSNAAREAEDVAAKLKRELESSGGKGSGTTIRLCNFRKDGYASLHGMMEKDRKNVLILPTTNEAEVSVVVSNMKTLAAEFDVVVIGNSRMPQFESIDPEHYHLGNLEFLTPYWPDPSKEVTRSFIHNYRVYFRADPDQYSIQGYDVTFFFVKALSDFGSDFRKCIYNEKAGLVQGTYHFSKTPSGGFINKGLSVIQYQPSFEIVRKKVYTE